MASVSLCLQYHMKWELTYLWPHSWLVAQLGLQSNLSSACKTAMLSYSFHSYLRLTRHNLSQFWLDLEFKEGRARKWLDLDGLRVWFNLIFLKILCNWNYLYNTLTPSQVLNLWGSSPFPHKSKKYILYRVKTVSSNNWQC